MGQINYTDEQLRQAVADNLSMAGVLRVLGLQQTGGGHRHLKLKVHRLGISTKHFTGQVWNKGKTYLSPTHQRYTDKEVFCKNSPVLDGNKLRKRLIARGWEYQCSKCRLSEWQGEEIALHLHHKNGVSDDNRYRNLCFLCPNCHQQTDNWGSKNRDVVERYTRSVENAMSTAHEGSNPFVPTKTHYNSRRCWR